MKRTLEKYSSLVITFVLLVNSVITPSLSLAAEMPNAEDIKNSITEKAENKTTQINADTSAATNPQSSPSQSQVANTGSDATVANDSQATSTTGVNNTNNTDIAQTINASANTGNNTASGNISINGGGAGLISTGDASVDSVGVVNAGSNTTDISSSSGSGGAGSQILNTGDNLSSTSNSSSSTTTLVNNGNFTLIHQLANVSANTGGNQADGNIAIGGGPAGVILTGSASTSTSFLVTAGGNVTLIGGTGGNGPGNGASIVLANSGRFATFNTSANTHHYTVVTNQNRALLSQTCGYELRPEQYVVDMSGCVANTGNNTSNGNIGMGADAGVINTGDAQVDVTMHADANNNETTIAGSSTGTGAESDVINTGDNVNVNTSATTSTSTAVNNNNTAKVNQTVNAYANTGNNTANGNISFGGRAGVINTGDAKVNVTMITDVNNNDTTLAGADASQGAGAATHVVNTGDDMNVNTTSDTTTTTQVNNINVLHLMQKVLSFVNTGGNTANGNIGGAAGIINTGHATSTVLMNVEANTSCTLIGVMMDICPDPELVQTPGSDTNIPTAPPLGGPASGESAQLNGGQSVTVAAAVKSTDTPSSTAGSVLGAAILPATGPELAVLALVASSILLAIGYRLRRFSA